MSKSLRKSTDRKSLPSWECGLKLLFRLLMIKRFCHSLRGSVDWNDYSYNAICFSVLSLPSWECGLKCNLSELLWFPTRVTPFVGVWIEIEVRRREWEKCRSHSLRGSVDWNGGIYLSENKDGTSLPSWECGLKSTNSVACPWQFQVTPFVGVWIEIFVNIGS